MIGPRSTSATHWWLGGDSTLRTATATATPPWLALSTTWACCCGTAASTARPRDTSVPHLLCAALSMRRKLYSDGHPDVIRSLGHLASLLIDRKEYGLAEEYVRTVLDGYRLLYPKERYADGHPYLARTLRELGTLVLFRREY